MCGRYAVEAKIRRRLLEEQVLRDLTDGWLWANRYNVAPSQEVPVIRAAEDGAEIVSMVWGFVPGFVKEEKPRLRPINARAETVAEKVFFRQSFARRRCLLPASGYYEWMPGPPKIPHYIHPIEDEVLLFAGVWDRWQDADRVAIIVGSASHALGHIHDRMPIMIPTAAWQDWLTGEDATRYLHPRTEGMVAYPVSTAVNKPVNQGSELIQPA